MYKKTLLSLAIASTLTLTGCLDNDQNKKDINGIPVGNENAGADTNGLTQEQKDGLVAAAGTYPIWNPALSALPIPNDLIFDKIAADGTFSVPDTSPPVTTALNSLSGASTVAPIDIAMSGLIDGDSLNGNALIAGPLPNPQQNVFLLELDYASGSPVQGLPIGEPPTVVSPTGNNYDAVEVELDGTSYIRINPIKPLKPNTRYIVVVTNEVKFGNGDNDFIQASPSYKHITGGDALLSDSLAPVRALTNGLWEKVAVGYFDAATNQVRPGFTLPALTADNIALSYSFTTSGDEKVMEYIANPSEWFNDQLTTFIGVSTAKSVTSNATDVDADGDVDYTDVNLAINATAGVEGFDGAMASFPSADIQAALSGLFDVGRPCNGLTSSTAISCISNSLAGAPTSAGGFSNLLPTPALQTATTTSANNPVSLVSAPVSSLVADALAATPPLVSQGTIDIPFYLGIPAGTEAADGAVINSQSWTADSDLATAINSAFYSIGLSLPQGRTTDPAAGFSPTNPPTLADFTVAAKSSVVNYIYPFPKQSDSDTSTAEQVDNLTIPWVAVYPHPASPVPAKGTVIYQHGITTDRSAVLSVGTVLAQQGFTVIGIDQLAHGVAPVSTASQLGLAETLLTIGETGGLPASLAPGDANNQAVVDGVLNVGFVSAAATGGDAAAAQGLINSVLGGGTSGDGALDTAIRTLASFENTVANAGSTIPGLAPTSNERHFNFTANASQSPIPMNYDPEAALGSSGSLFINLSGFTNSRDKNRQGVIDLLNLRQSLANIDLNGDTTTGDLDTTNVYFSGHSLGTVSGIPFVTIANSTPNIGNIEAASYLEPASGITRMLENSGSFSPTILGGLAASGLTQGTANFETYLNVLQATLDSVDPINFADNLGGSATGSFQTNADVEGSLLIINVGTADGNGTTVFKSDQTNVIEAETTQLGNASASLFAGVEKFANQLGVNDVIGATPDGTADKLRSRLAFGNHGMFVLPIVSAAETAALGATEAAAETLRRQAAFQEGLTQTATFFITNGEMTGITDEAGLTAVPSILINSTDYDARPNKQLN